MFYASTKNTRRWGATGFPDWLEAVVGYVVFAVGMYVIAVWGDVYHPLRMVLYTVGFFVLVDVVCAVVRWHWRRREQSHRR